MAEIRVKGTGTIKLFESDNTSSVTIASPASLSADKTITLPDADVTLASGTMLATDGSGASLTALNASELGSGTVPTARLGSGTASSTTVLYGDQTYKTEPSGVALTGSTDNTVVTVTGADAISGEAKLTFDGTTLTANNTTGTSATVENLVITSDTDANPAYANIKFTSGTGGNVAGCWIKGIQASGGDDGRLEFHTNNAGTVNEVMRISYDEKVLIGGTAGTQKLRVETDENISPCYFLNTNTTTGATQFNFECMNTSTSSYNLMHISRAGASQVQIQSDGDILNVNNSYGQISDERLKKDIVDANSQWDDIKALRVRNFKFKTSRFEEEDFSQIGVVAQEVEAAGMNGLIEDSLPQPYHVPINSDFGTIEAGTEDNGAEPIEDKDGNITGYEDLFTKGQKVKSLKYSVLYMKAIKALQESMERIETLEAKVTALENA